MALEKDLIDDVGMLKGKVESLSLIANKLDIIIERLVDQHDRHIVRVYDDMEKRRMETQDQVKEIHERIDMVLEKIQSTDKNMSDKFENLQKCINSHNKEEKQKLDDLLRWKWTVAGGIVVAAWLLSHLTPDTIVKLFH
jgi:chromosome segregation ATPase